MGVLVPPLQGILDNDRFTLNNLVLLTVVFESYFTFNTDRC